MAARKSALNPKDSATGRYASAHMRDGQRKDWEEKGEDALMVYIGVPIRCSEENTCPLRTFKQDYKAIAVNAELIPDTLKICTHVYTTLSILWALDLDQEHGLLERRSGQQHRGETDSSGGRHDLTGSSVDGVGVELKEGGLARETES